VRNKTPATKVEKVEFEPRSGANIGDYSGRLRLLSGVSNKANLVSKRRPGLSKLGPQGPLCKTKPICAVRHEQ
jgi:hypothetical protein